MTHSIYICTNIEEGLLSLIGVIIIIVISLYFVLSACDQYGCVSQVCICLYLLQTNSSTRDLLLKFVMIFGLNDVCSDNSSSVYTST